MKPQIHFFVEDITHQLFLQCYIQHTFNIQIDETHFTKTKSWGGIKLENKKVKELIDLQIPFLIFIDSDIEQSIRSKELIKVLEDVKKIIGSSFTTDSFLFPDNKSKGNIETLLTLIAQETSIIECFEKYEACISNFNPPAKKAKIYAYLEALDGEIIKEEKRDYSKATHWNLNHPSLDPLKAFLAPFFIKN